MIDYPPSSLRGPIVFVPRTNTVFAGSGDGDVVLATDMTTGVVAPPIYHRGLACLALSSHA